MLDYGALGTLMIGLESIRQSGMDVPSRGRPARQNRRGERIRERVAIALRRLAQRLEANAPSQPAPE
jgi:hypothetical protein